MDLDLFAIKNNASALIAGLVELIFVKCILSKLNILYLFIC
jgi:hypothetical protein